MLTTLAGACRVMDLRDGAPFHHDALRVWRHVGRESGANAVSLRVIDLEPGGAAGLRNGECEEVLFVLAGRGAVILDGARYELEPESGVFVRPGALVSLESKGPEPMTLVSSQCPDPGPTVRLEPPAAPSRATGRDPAPVARLWDREARPTGDRWYRVLVDDALGSTQVTQFVGAIPPGRAPDHFHEYEEVLCILAGQGRMWAGGASTPIAPGSLVFLPRRQVHCTENTGGDELRLLGVFYPAGSPAVAYRAD
jgi:mannose-6-phosphate isomerase-like protein (cupin superfamily)